MSLERFGIVVIGRNEGERLRRCLSSAAGQARLLVYVDSGSTDGSVSLAVKFGAEIVQLDMSVPFTAARARNAGFARLRELSPKTDYVQFVDGDCEIVAGWFDFARRFLDAHSDVAAVCGRRRERDPGRSVYNLLCDIEWNSPVGETKACGGDAMMRVAALVAVGGYRPDLIAGEEPELCVRLRAAGWRIWRGEADMTLHDAAMLRFSQWWRRSKRAGYAFAEGAHLHGAAPERHGVRESRSAWFWGMGIPMAILVLAPWWGGWVFILLLIYPAQVIRLARRGRLTSRENWLNAAFLVLGKFPELSGQMTFFRQRIFGTRSDLIEYK